MSKISILNVELATTHGLKASIFVTQLGERIGLNAPDDEFKINEGKRYIKLSGKELNSMLPYFSDKQIRTIASDCILKNLISKKQLNDDRMNRTNWYCVL